MSTSSQQRSLAREHLSQAMQHLEFARKAATDECSDRYYLAATETRIADYAEAVAWRTRITEAQILVRAIYGET
jgi:hypothetical protein